MDNIKLLITQGLSSYYQTLKYYGYKRRVGYINLLRLLLTYRFYEDYEAFLSPEEESTFRRVFACMTSQDCMLNNPVKHNPSYTYKYNVYPVGENKREFRSYLHT
jgi:hypothetical protein|nr:MAG TPA: Z1 domain protein [Crassvirales sp.]